MKFIWNYKAQYKFYPTKHVITELAGFKVIVPTNHISQKIQNKGCA